MKKLILLVLLFITSLTLYGQEIIKEKPSASGFLFAISENIMSNVLLHLADRYIAEEAYAQVTLFSIWKNLSNPWEWDRDEYFTNQFGHPYQGSVYHAAARSNGFNFYQSVLFDAFGSLSWELFAETNAPSINDFISTTIGGASLGEMFHRLYLETPNPFAVLVSPSDAINNLITNRYRPAPRNIYSLKLASGLGYTHAEQSIEQDIEDEFLNLNTRDMVSADIACTIVYGNPFTQRSVTPYKHFELSLYANLGYPFWYNLKLLSDGYLFSFPVLDTENKTASTGLSLHYDLFADRQIDFFGQAIDWTYKYKKRFTRGTEVEFKGHIGWTVFSADTFYIQNEYSGIRRTENDYGTGANMKLTFAIQTQKRKRFELLSYAYQVFNIFQNEDKKNGSHLCLFMGADYSVPIGKQTSLGIAASLLWQRAYYDGQPDTQKRTHDAKLYIAWEW
jgi:hypothetical protein